MGLRMVAGTLVGPSDSARPAGGRVDRSKDDRRDDRRDRRDRRCSAGGNKLSKLKQSALPRQSHPGQESKMSPR